MEWSRHHLFPTLPSHPTKQQIESRQLDNKGNDIDAVVEQIPFLFIELGEILPVLVVLEQEYMIGIIQGQHDDCEKQDTEEDVSKNHIQDAQ